MKPFLPVPKKYLLLISGLMWSGVGVLLITRASTWLKRLEYDAPWMIILAGVIPGMLIAAFGFTRIVHRNIQRIEAMDSKVSMFAFQDVRSYLLIIVMMSMGIAVRNTSIIPMILKTPGYYTIGTALSLSSIKYYRTFFRRF